MLGHTPAIEVAPPPWQRVTAIEATSTHLGDMTYSITPPMHDAEPHRIIRKQQTTASLSRWASYSDRPPTTCLCSLKIPHAWTAIKIPTIVSPCYVPPWSANTRNGTGECKVQMLPHTSILVSKKAISAREYSPKA